MTKSLKKRIESLTEKHGAYQLRYAVQSAMKGNRDALRALELDDCYNLELREIIKMTGRQQKYDPDTALRKMLG